MYHDKDSNPAKFALDSRMPFELREIVLNDRKFQQLFSMYLRLIALQKPCIVHKGSAGKFLTVLRDERLDSEITRWVGLLEKRVDAIVDLCVKKVAQKFREDDVLMETAMNHAAQVMRDVGVSVDPFRDGGIAFGEMNIMPADDKNWIFDGKFLNFL